MASSAEQIAATLGLIGQDEPSTDDAQPDTTAVEAEDVDGAEVEDESSADTETDPQQDEVEDSTEETDEEKPEETELSPSVKEILRKNRADVRAANKRAAAGDRYKNLVVRGALRDAFAEAGLTEVPESMFRLIDMSKVDISDKSELTGLEEQIASLKEDFSGLFDKRPQPPRRRLSAEGAPRPAPRQQKSSAELLAERISR